MNREILEAMQVLLNSLLKEHPKYEQWVNFDSVAFDSRIGWVPRVSSPEQNQTSLNPIEISNIYDSVCQKIIKKTY